MWLICLSIRLWAGSALAARGHARGKLAQLSRGDDMLWFALTHFHVPLSFIQCPGSRACPLWLKAFQCPMSPLTAQTLKQKMEIKRCLSCLRGSKSFCYLKLCVFEFVCVRAHTRAHLYLLLFIPVTCFLFTVVEKRGFCSIYSLSRKTLCTGANKCGSDM